MGLANGVDTAPRDGTRTCDTSACSRFLEVIGCTGWSSSLAKRVIDRTQTVFEIKVFPPFRGRVSFSLSEDLYVQVRAAEPWSRGNTQLEFQDQVQDQRRIGHQGQTWRTRDKWHTEVDGSTISGI